MRKKILFIDRDGTIIREPETDFQIDELSKFCFFPGVIGALRKIAEETDYRLVLVTNQDGLGTGRFPAETFWPLQQLMERTLEGEGIVFDEILIDSSLPEEYSFGRKPGIGLVEKYLNENLDYENSYVIGDRLTDMQLAANMGLKGIYLGMQDWKDLPVVYVSRDWNMIYAFLKQRSRRVERVRKTEETDVRISLNLEGSGRGKVHTGIAFFDHMLLQVARHGGVDLEIEVRGDLEVDEHHTIEDTGLVLGECFRTALGSKKGIERYGFALPMDDSKTEVLLDFGGRMYLKWEVEFCREYVGDCPTEMIRHFFASFCQGCMCNLHVKADGENTHHLIESIFKAFARSVRAAVRQTGITVPSSKGMI